MIKESLLHKQVKAILIKDDISEKIWNIAFNEEIIGTVKKLYRETGNYRAYTNNGRWVGSGTTIKEARIMIGEEYIGYDNIIYED